MIESRPISTAAPSTGPDPLLKERLLAAARVTPSPTRRERARHVTLLVTLSWVIALVVFVSAGGPRPTGRPLALSVGTAGGTASIVAVCVWALLLRGRSTLGRTRRVLLAVALGAVPSILVWKVFWSMRFESALDEWPTRPGLKCLALTLGVATVPLLAFLLTRNGSDPKHPALTGFSGGVAIGATSTLLTDLWCPVAFIPHLLLGHVLPVALLGGAGALLGVVVLRMREKD